MYQGQSLRCTRLDGDIAELCFDRQDAPINKFDRQTLDELADAAKALAADDSLRGLVVTSAKSGFIVGADILEFGAIFAQPEAQIVQWLHDANQIFNAIEDLPFPSVTAINGIALGGGMEMCLSTDYRVMAEKAQVGLPEVKLGIYPGFGGTVRLPRLIGADNAIEWIAGGTPNKAEAAFKVGAVDAVVPAEKLQEAALRLIELANAGDFDWRARRAQKKAPLRLNQTEALMVFETAKGFIAGKAGKHYPAPIAAVNAIQQAATRDRDGALEIEAAGFAEVAKTQVASSLIGIFLNDQLLKKKAKQAQKLARPVKQAAVLGAGIMGGGIAYQSASKGTPIIMKDIRDEQLDLGMSEANKLLGKLVSREKITPRKAGEILADIRPTLNYGDFGSVDIVVEAVVENPKVKKAVLAEVEGSVREGTVLASNTSSISIDELAGALEHPENFLGMHFFNPVHRMPLVEVIRGEQTSDEAIATTVAYATAMGKTAIVVNNCPGFLVNRVLFPYFGGFMALVRDGADFAEVDKVMEGFGWPMGPAYLQDVVGMDTAHHVGDVLAEGYPDRMGKTFESALDVMYAAERFGQKNGVGFYRYSTDRKGKPQKERDEEAYKLLASVQPDGQKSFSAEEIIDRHMLPMIIETARCLEEGIVETPNEADMGLILGIGFPPHHGGALKYADTLGMQTVLDKCATYEHLGKLYEPTDRMKEMAANGETYYGS
ncbi:MAG: fatty acid oxidation complex subunit alpha FadB [Xanthomonadales bacterium]|jgi:3-hydroxyacyl-CoA dehydrogenase/enoyl-CoA hydratase/3-hydroxybutyryl-CoA epimerase/enoyl-CoA isomerase|nr:fatty acid oxidation complex subunit alpha FadB [Xanthomonadales bacterium]